MGLTETILLIAVLIVAAAALIVVEICTPAFGLLAVLAIGCVVWAVYLCYTISGLVGIVATIVGTIVLPAYAIAAVKIIPRTALGQRLGLKRGRARRGEGTPEADGLSKYIGRTTTAESTLRPSGMIRIEGRRVVAQAESGLVEKGQTVKVIRAAGSYVVVRKVDT